MPTLAKLVESRGPLPLEEAGLVSRNAALELARWHEAHGPHGDITPASLHVDSHAVVTIAAPAPTTDPGSDEKVVGTIGYIAPEQSMGNKELDSRRDIYGLGCTIYYILMGKPPFERATLAESLWAQQADEPVFHERIPAPLVDICRRMMAKNLSDRYRTAGTIVVDLDDWLKHGSGR